MGLLQKALEEQKIKDKSGGLLHKALDISKNTNIESISSSPSDTGDPKKKIPYNA